LHLNLSENQTNCNVTEIIMTMDRKSYRELTLAGMCIITACIYNVTFRYRISIPKFGIENVHASNAHLLTL